MSKSEYDVEVVVSIPINVTVRAYGKDEAMDIAENMAYDIFKEDLVSGDLKAGDFNYEAQTP